MAMYGGATNYGYMNALHHLVTDVVAGFALRAAMRGFEMQFASLRERLQRTSRRSLFQPRRADQLADAELRLLSLRSDSNP